MKLRFILIGILVIVWGYFIYMNNQKDINARVAESEKLIATNSGLIKQAELTIIEKTAENQHLLAIVEAWKKRVEVTSAPVNKPSSDANTWWLQAPSDKVKEYLRHCQLTKDGELVTDGEWNWILETPYTGTMEWFTLIPDCGAFVWIEWCYLRQADQSNCYWEIIEPV